MPLTPEDVSNKRFTPVRLREGYDMGEVDQFLDEVEAELARLIRENDDLREKLPAAQDAPAAAAAAPVAQPEPEPEPAPEPEPRRGRARARAGAGARSRPPWSPRAPAEEIKVTTVAEASAAAARLLEIATQQRRPAGRRGQGRGRQDHRRRPHQGRAARSPRRKTKADRLESDARTRSQMLDSETAERRKQLFGDLEKEKDKLNAEVENLRSFEREYRSRLKSYFSSSSPRSRATARAPAPTRRSLEGRTTPRRSGSGRCSGTTSPDTLTGTPTRRATRARVTASCVPG